VELTKRVWRRLAQPRFGLPDRISEAIAARELSEPGLLTDIRTGREVLLVCDFTGQHRGARYEAFAFLATSIAYSGPWMESHVALRNRLLPDGRRMAYKAWGDAVRRRALVPFLEAGSLLEGNLVVFLISRQIRSLFSDPGDRRLFPEFVAERGWNHHWASTVGPIPSVCISLLERLARSTRIRRASCLSRRAAWQGYPDHTAGCGPNSPWHARGRLTIPWEALYGMPPAVIGSIPAPPCDMVSD
jgi:hypothetical protein